MHDATSLNFYWSRKKKISSRNKYIFMTIVFKVGFKIFKHMNLLSPNRIVSTDKNKNKNITFLYDNNYVSKIQLSIYFYFHILC